MKTDIRGNKLLQAQIHLSRPGDKAGEDSPLALRPLEGGPNVPPGSGHSEGPLHGPGICIHQSTSVVKGLTAAYRASVSLRSPEKEGEGRENLQVRSQIC